MKSKLENLIKQLREAFKRFEDVMQKEKDEYIRDSAIQRFEFTFELVWKTLKVYLESEKGLRVYSPRDAVKSAFQVGLIGDDIKWIEMIETRNLTSHVYNEEIAEKVYKSISSYLPLIRKLVDDLSAHISHH